MQITCSQCAAEVEVRQGETFLFCPFCDSSLYLDRSKVVFNYRLKPTLDQGSAQAALFRWMGGNDTVKDLDSKAKVQECRFVYHPFWYFRLRDDKGESIKIQLAHPSAISELSEVSVPAGGLVFLEAQDFNAEDYLEPTIHLEQVLRDLPGEHIQESAVVFVPIFRFSYVYESALYSALVDGSSGKVFATVFPKKSETPFMGMGILCCAVFLVLGLVTGSDFLAKSIAFGIAIPPLMAAAYHIARKV